MVFDCSPTLPWTRWAKTTMHPPEPPVARWTLQCHYACSLIDGLPHDTKESNCRPSRRSQRRRPSETGLVFLGCTCGLLGYIVTLCFIFRSHRLPGIDVVARPLQFFRLSPLQTKKPHFPPAPPDPVRATSLRGWQVHPRRWLGCIFVCAFFSECSSPVAAAPLAAASCCGWGGLRWDVAGAVVHFRQLM